MPEDKDDRRRSTDPVERDAFERRIATDLDEETPDKPKGMALHTKILIGLVVGTIAGVAVNWRVGGDNPRVAWVVDNFTHPVGQLFLRLLLMIVVPLVFSSLVVGVAGIGDIRKLGRVGFKSFAYCLDNLGDFSGHRYHPCKYDSTRQEDRSRHIGGVAAALRH